MSSINIEKLLRPISDESPCGQDLEYDPAFMEIENKLEGKAKQQMGDAVIEAEEPDWKKIVSDSTELLDRTHDLRVLIFLIRSAIEKDGFSSFSDGLTVLSAWIETQWPDVYPLLDPNDGNDPTERINVIMTLSDWDAFLNPLISIPIVESKALGSYNLKQIREIKNGVGEASYGTIEAAIADSDLKQLQLKSEWVSQSIEMLERIEKNVTQYVGVDNAPSLKELLNILKEILLVISEYTFDRNHEQTVAISEQQSKLEIDDHVLINPANNSQGIGNINSSQDVTEALGKIIEYYVNNEPSSPIPMLLKRAKRLVNMDFMSIIKNLASDSESQVMNIRGPIEEE